MDDAEFEELKSLGPLEMLDRVASVRSSGNLVMPDDTNHWLGLADSFAWNMRHESNTERMRLFARAAISVYDLLSESSTHFNPGFDISAMYLRTHLIDKLGIRPGDYLEGLEIIVDWFLSSTHYLPDEARQESERFWPRVREHGIQPDDFEMLRHIRRIRNRLGVLKHLKASGVEFEDARIEEWLEVRDSLL